VAIQRLLRRQVVGRAQHTLVVFLGENVFFIEEESSQAHVQDFDNAGAIDQNVCRA